MANTMNTEPDRIYIRESLPLYAQKIYWEAYCDAFQKCRCIKTWFGSETNPDDSARHLAWQAVKKEYENRGGAWQKK
ncbi:MAG: ChaB family protein [Rhodospirillales bacterium]|nr:ChaB family protein [Rhodospirillales bacterium]MCB9996231.1 ChaB family protein [Rhodospirillales bacterium]